MANNSLVRGSQSQNNDSKINRDEGMVDIGLGCRRKIPSILDRRNGIPVPQSSNKMLESADYTLGYFNNSKHGGGFVPGSNFGFARATETTKDSLKVFGKSLAQLWKRDSRIPDVITKCIEYLVRPGVCDNTSLYEDVAYDYYDIEPYAVVAKSNQGKAQQQISTHEQEANAAKIREHVEMRSQIRRLKSVFNAARTVELDDSTVKNPKVVVGVLIQFLKELNPALMTYELHDIFISTVDDQRVNYRIESLKPTLAKLPKVNEMVFQLLIGYFNKVITSSKATGISQRLASAFAPALLREDPLKPKSQLGFDQDTLNARRLEVIQCILDNARFLFPSSVLTQHDHNGESLGYDTKRQIALKIQDHDDVLNLDGWNSGKARISSRQLTSRSNNSSQRELRNGEEGASEDMDIEDQELEELRQLAAAYRSETTS